MTLELTPEEIKILLQVLSQGPYHAVAPLINKIQKQAMEQTNEA